MNKFRLFSTITLLLTISTLFAAAPKREFRGAWIQAVNGQFQGIPTAELKQTLISQLDSLEKARINAVLFQVRVEGDALYKSSIEPWSKYLTGKQGVAPDEDWDPLQFMIDECHKRDMELHAWINPYRAKTKGTAALSPIHPYNQHPELFVKYADQLYFDPALPENRKYICKIVRDIVSRYDIDAIHMDDYFYPYPNPGEDFPDYASFAQYGRGYSNKADWRRDNVNVLIKEIHETVRDCKPWVKFGISPFGIYRNQKSDPEGSLTNGLQNYDDLYADVLYWIEQGWVDYCIPQVYWEIGHKAADYDTLVQWWAKYASNRPLYIGQDVQRTVKAKDAGSVTGNQQAEKYRMQRAQANVQGCCFWDAASAANNADGYRDYLASGMFRYPALMPLYRFIDGKAPAKVDGVRLIEENGERVLVWLLDENAAKDAMDAPYRYVVYCFGKGEKVNIGNAGNIIAITSKPFYKLPAELDGKCTFVVTVLDRMQNESKGYKCKAKF